MKHDAKTTHDTKSLKKMADSMNNPAHEAANRRGLLRLGEEYDKTRRN